MMFKKIIKVILNIAHQTFKILKVILICYAIIFSLAVTISAFMAFNFICKPINEVKALIKKNPEKTVFMELFLENSNDEQNKDSLLHKFIPLDSISSFLVNSVIAAEDDGFYTHPGIDIEAILNAMEHNRTHGGIKHGASTITQQLAKNLFLSSERSYNRKIMELLYSFLLERYLGKKRILELYLNYAQWGKNIFGCEAASQYYFKKSSRKVNRNESARLAAVLSMPSKLTPHHTTSYMNKRIVMIAQNLYLHKSIDTSVYHSLTGDYPASKENNNETQSDTTISEVNFKKSLDDNQSTDTNKTSQNKNRLHF